MKAARLVLVIAASLFVADCRDEAGPTAPAPAVAPSIAGTWTGTATSGGTWTCPATFEIEQPNAGREVTGRITSSCGLPNSDFRSGELYARLVEGLPWAIVGTVSYTNHWGSHGYGAFTTNLRGSLEGAPVSRISATTDGFRKRGSHSGVADPMQFEVTRSAQ